MASAIDPEEIAWRRPSDKGKPAVNFYVVDICAFPIRTKS